MLKAKSKNSDKPSYIYENGKPTAVILNLKAYQKMLEQLEDALDVKLVKKLKKKKQVFTKFDEFFREEARVRNLS